MNNYVLIENQRIIKELAGHFESDKERELDIFEKIKLGKIDFVREFDDLNRTDKAGFSLLCVAVQAWEDEIVQLLISKQANVDVGCINGTKASPLHYATMGGNTAMVHALLSA